MPRPASECGKSQFSRPPAPIYVTKNFVFSCPSPARPSTMATPSRRVSLGARQIRHLSTAVFASAPCAARAFSSRTHRSPRHRCRHHCRRRRFRRRVHRRLRRHLRPCRCRCPRHRRLSIVPTWSTCVLSILRGRACPLSTTGCTHAYTIVPTSCGVRGPMSPALACSALQAVALKTAHRTRPLLLRAGNIKAQPSASWSRPSQWYLRHRPPRLGARHRRKCITVPTARRRRAKPAIVPQQSREDHRRMMEP